MEFDSLRDEYLFLATKKITHTTRIRGRGMRLSKLLSNISGLQTLLFSLAVALGVLYLRIQADEPEKSIYCSQMFKLTTLTAGKE